MAEALRETHEAEPQPLTPSPLWRNRDYMLMWTGQMVSVFGSSLSFVALPLIILKISGSPAQAGFVEALFALPWLFLSLPAGAYVDRWDRKLVMIVCNAVFATGMGLIAGAYLAGHLAMYMFYVTAPILGTAFVLFNLSETSALPRVVPKEQLPTASAQNEAVQAVAGLGGPPLGGFLYQTIGPVVPFVFDAITYLFSAVALTFVRTSFQEDRKPKQDRNLRREIAEGISWLWHHPLIRFMAFLVGGMNFCSAATGLILIVIARHQGTPAGYIGLMFSIAALGGLLGAVLAPRIQRRFSFGQVIISTSFLSALVWPLYAIAPNFIFLGAAFAIGFMITPIFNAVQFAYRLALIPDDLQGRVNSSFRLLAFGFQPLGAALGGALLQSIGPQPTVMVFFVVALALAAATAANSRVRHARPITEAVAT